MPVAINYSNFFYWHFKMLGDERKDAGVCHIALGFFAHGNNKMVFLFLLQRFFTRPGGNLCMDILHPYFSLKV